MKVKELIGTLRDEKRVEIREKDYHLCYADTGNVFLKVFSECKVIDWFVAPNGTELVINVEKLPKELLELIERQQSGGSI